MRKAGSILGTKLPAFSFICSHSETGQTGIDVKAKVS
jgi:hypothetical protein